jgi:CheY-like chemotaxis protein
MQYVPFVAKFVWMPIVRLVSWNPDTVLEHARDLKKAGFTVDASVLRTSGLIGQFRDHIPAVILIDLDRLPSHGRAVAIVLRSGKSTRHIPIVFAGGLEEKVKTARAQTPWAILTDWSGVADALKKALKKRAIPGSGKSYMAQYAGSSLVKKLGFKPNMRTALLGAPEGFEEQLGELPEGVEFETEVSPRTKMAIWFVRSLRELADETDYLSARLPTGVSLWMVYPKQTSRFKVDFTQVDVRAIGLAAGLVDYKICAVDSDWTGLKFARKKS